MHEPVFIPRALRLTAVCLGLAALVAGCSTAGLPGFAPAAPKAVAARATPRVVASSPRNDEVLPLAFVAARPAAVSGKADIDDLIDKYADIYDVPASLIHRVVRRESGYNAGARNGPYYGLMQIRHDTARSMGYSGSAGGLLDAETNLKYAVKYLRGAYVVGGYNSDKAVRNYARGYYYDAKRAGLLDAVGLR